MTFRDVAASLRPSFCRVDSPLDAFGTSLRRCARRCAASTRRSTFRGRCCAAAPLHSCTAASLHCCERQHSPERQQTNDKQTNDSRQTTNEHRRERQRAQRAVLSLNDETTGRQTTDVERHQTIRSKVQFRRFFDPLDPRACARAHAYRCRIVVRRFADVAALLPCCTVALLHCRVAALLRCCAAASLRVVTFLLSDKRQADKRQAAKRETSTAGKDSARSALSFPP